MAHTRTLTHTIHKADGAPWAGFSIGFDTLATATVPHATLPGTVYTTVYGDRPTLNTQTVITDADGAFSVDLEVELPIRVTLTGAIIGGLQPPTGSQFTIVIPAGTTPITLAEVVASGAVTPPGAEWANLLAAHTSDTGNPHSVTKSQVGLANVTNDAQLTVDQLVTILTGDLDTDVPSVKAVNTALALKADDADLTAHTGNTSNPHAVTKAQVGLGNADNTSDANKPVSAATQAALNLKANSADLGTAASTNSSDYATATQGSKADTAVQPSAPLTTAIANQHTHANKTLLDTYTQTDANLADAVAKKHAHANLATLDTVTAAGLVPAPGSRGAVLTVGASGRAWADVPGIVYPSLLLSPDGSFDRSGAVSLDINTAFLVAGRYGQAWSRDAGSGTARKNVLTTTRGTLIVRGRVRAGGSGSQAVFRSNPLELGPNVGYYVPSGMLFGGYTVYTVQTAPMSLNQWYEMAVSWSGSMYRVVLNGVLCAVSIASSPPIAGAINQLTAVASVYTDVESALLYPAALPASEIARISNLPAAWTMENAAANIYQPTSAFSQFAPNKAITAGGTTLRTAPGAATTQIATLAAAALVEDSGRIVNSGGTDYSLVATSSAGQGWIPASALTAL